MKKVAIITDQHFGCRGDHLGFLNYQEQFYKNVFFPYIDQHNITTIFDLGDTFDRRKYVNYYTLNQVKRFWFDEVKKRNIKLKIILGNHTTYFKNTNQIHSLELFKNDFDVITEPTVQDNMLFLPWINGENQQKALELIDKTYASICFGHLQLQGFEMHMGSVADHGLDPTVFKKFDAVYSGHFHHKSDRGNIHYLGAPYEITWADFGDPRGFSILDLETNSIEYIQNPYSMFHKVLYSDDLDVTKFDFKKYQNRYVKVIILKKENPYVFDTFISKLE